MKEADRQQYSISKCSTYERSSPTKWQCKPTLARQIGISKVARVLGRPSSERTIIDMNSMHSCLLLPSLCRTFDFGPASRVAEAEELKTKITCVRLIWSSLPPRLATVISEYGCKPGAGCSDAAASAAFAEETSWQGVPGQAGSGTPWLVSPTAFTALQSCTANLQFQVYACACEAGKIWLKTLFALLQPA